MSDASLQAHLKGQKHARNLEREVSWTEAAKRSVYVGGVETIPAVELSLADYFSQFGTVKKITTDKSKVCFLNNFFVVVHLYDFLCTDHQT